MHQTSCNETPQQNSTIERKHQHVFIPLVCNCAIELCIRVGTPLKCPLLFIHSLLIKKKKNQHVLNVTRCIMFQSNFPRAFWSFVVVHVVHLINRLPSPVIQNNCPYKLLYNCVPDLSDIKVFGCLCFASNLEQNRSKLDPRARKCIFLGYKQGTKGYIVMDVHSRETFVSRNVIFYETYFYDLKERNEQVITEETNDPMRYHCDDSEHIGIEKNLTEQEEQDKAKNKLNMKF